MITVQDLTEYCLSKLGAMLDYPFGPDPAVFKAGGKIFALLTEENGITRISLKCEPLRADFLRRQYSSIMPGYHLNKVHWNSVFCDGSVPDSEVFGQIDHSHELIIKSLSKKTQKRLKDESHPLYLFPDDNYQPLDRQVGDEYYPNGIFIFHITRLLEHIAANGDEYTTEEIRVTEYMSSFRRLSHEECADVDIQKPVILAEISPGRYNIIDGNHRICKAHYDGVETLKAYKLSPKQHSLFITERKAYDTYIEYWNEKLQYL